MSQDIFPMASGGAWLAEGGAGEPIYVANPDHIDRLLREGYVMVDDPRSSKAAPPSASPAPLEAKDEDKS